MRLVSSDGTVTVETIRLSGTNGRDGDWLRVRRGRYHVAEVRTVAELSALGIDWPTSASVNVLVDVRDERHTGRLR